MSVDAKIAALEHEIAALKQEKALCADEAEQEWQDVWRYLFDVNGYVRCPAPLCRPRHSQPALFSGRLWHCALRSDCLRHSALRFGTAHRFGTALFLC